MPPSSRTASLSAEVAELVDSIRGARLAIVRRRAPSRVYHSDAEVAELVDAHDSKSCSFGGGGSIPPLGTNTIHPPTFPKVGGCIVFRCCRESPQGHFLFSSSFVAIKQSRERRKRARGVRSAGSTSQDLACYFVSGTN